MWLMLQQEKPDDYVIATGETHSVKEFVEEAFKLVGLDWQNHVELDARYRRSTESIFYSEIPIERKKICSGNLESVSRILVRIMVEGDLELARREAHMNDYRVERAESQVGRDVRSLTFEVGRPVLG
jgi:GDPmannose 4,6-dehydratase